MKRTVFSIIVLTTLLLTACSAALREADIDKQVVESAPINGVVAPPVAYAPGADGSMVTDASVAVGGGFAGEGFVAQETVANAFANDRMVIKNATLSLVVDDPAAAVDAVTQMAEGMGGFVVALNTYQTYYGPESTLAEQANMTIRVPSDKLSEALRQLKGMAVEVKNETVSGQDVTSEYTDLQSRLKNLEAAERQLQSIMEEATKTEDVLAVYNQLVYTREQIEVIRGQMKYYEQSAAMSAITLDLIPNVVTQPIEVGGWHPEGAVKEAIEDTVRFLQNFTDGLIYFAIARLPFLIVFGIPALLVGRWLWKRAQKSAPKPAPTGTN
jgi:hypothetical protein